MRFTEGYFGKYIKSFSLSNFPVKTKLNETFPSIVSIQTRKHSIFDVENIGHKYMKNVELNHTSGNIVHEAR